MAKAILICGKICSGKTFLSRRLKEKENAVVLSCDEIMTLFPPIDGDEAYAEVSEKVRACLKYKAADIIRCGTSVILDWGFWRKADRVEAVSFFTEQGIPAVWYYLDVSDGQWERNIEKRNARPGPADYYVDAGLKEKCKRLFEAPDVLERAAWPAGSVTIETEK